MQSIFFEQAQKNFDKLCQETYQNHEPCIINRKDNKHIVVLSLEDFNAWQETNYLLSTPVNAERLIRSLKKARNGELTEKILIEE